jgi:hypothetical protein
LKYVALYLILLGRKSPSKEKDLVSSPKSRVSRTGSGSFFSNKASVLNNNLFAEPKQDEQGINENIIFFSCKDSLFYFSLIKLR